VLWVSDVSLPEPIFSKHWQDIPRLDKAKASPTLGIFGSGLLSYL
jgi:hypothetical protein